MAPATTVTAGGASSSSTHAAAPATVGVPRAGATNNRAASANLAVHVRKAKRLERRCKRMRKATLNLRRNMKYWKD
eukprot:7742759-Alexandrium_andersonii.AAC.1